MASYKLGFGVLLTGATFLAACTTPGDLASAERFAEYEVHASERQVSSCILDGWESHRDFLGGTLNISYRPTVDGARVVAKDPAGFAITHAMVDISQHGEHVSVQYYARSMFAFRQKFNDVIRVCAESGEQSGSASR